MPERIPVPRPREARLTRKIRKRTISSGVEAPSVAFIADVHSNTEALNAVLADISSRTEVGRVFCSGDIVGYGPEPNRICEKIRDSGIACCQGNHDLFVDLRDLRMFNPHAKEALIWTSQRLTQENKQWLLNLPKVYDETVNGRAIQLVHGSPVSPMDEKVTPETPQDTLKHYLNMSGADTLVTGHTHLPFVRNFGKKMFVNAGSVGQPRDGDPRASYVVVDLERMKGEIVRMEYNIEAVATKIKAVTLPDFLAERLFKGI